MNKTHLRQILASEGLRSPNQGTSKKTSSSSLSAVMENAVLLQLKKDVPECSRSRVDIRLEVESLTVAIYDISKGSPLNDDEYLDALNKKISASLKKLGVETELVEEDRYQISMLFEVTAL